MIVMSDLKVAVFAVSETFVTVDIAVLELDNSPNLLTNFLLKSCFTTAYKKLTFG